MKKNIYIYKLKQQQLSSQVP